MLLVGIRPGAVIFDASPGSGRLRWVVAPLAKVPYTNARRIVSCVGAVTPPDGRRKIVYGKTRKAALAKLREVERAVEDGLPVTTTPVTVAEYMQSWLTTTLPARVATGRLAPSTLDSYTDNTRKHIVPELFCTPGLGLRHGEALGLQWAGIDFEQQTVKISRSLQRLRAPKDPDTGKHQDKLALTVMKTEASAASPALPQFATDALHDHRQLQLAARRGRSAGFLARRGKRGPPIGFRQVSRRPLGMISGATLQAFTACRVSAGGDPAGLDGLCLSLPAPSISRSRMADARRVLSDGIDVPDPSVPAGPVQTNLSGANTETSSRRAERRPHQARYSWTGCGRCRRGWFVARCD